MKAETKDFIADCRKLARPYRVEDGKDFKLKDVDPDGTGPFKESEKEITEQALAHGKAALSEMQERLYAQDRGSVLLIFQAITKPKKDPEP